MQLDSTQHWKNNRLLLFLTLSLVLTISWLGLLDHSAKIQIDDSLAHAGIIYGTARSINGLVSMLQGTEVTLFMFSVSVGELLDPINDLIERFSSVISYALASLVLQKTLLHITSHHFFNILLTLAAVGVIVGKFAAHPRLFTISLKIFLTLAFVRMAFALVISLNIAANTVFLEGETEANHRIMNQYQQRLASVSSDLTFSKSMQTKEETNRDRSNIEYLKQKRKKVSEHINKEQIEIAQKEESIRQEGGKLPRVWWQPWKRDSVKLEELKSDLRQLEAEKESLEEELSNLDEDIECVKKLSNGKFCSVFDRIPTFGNPVAALKNFRIEEKIEDLKDNANEFVDSTLTLMALLILKSIIFPVFFWWLLYGILKQIWGGFREHGT